MFYRSKSEFAGAGETADDNHRYSYTAPPVIAPMRA
jgi:hypothetical protein